MLKNNIFSTNSPWYIKNKKKNNRVPLEDILNIEDGEY